MATRKSGSAALTAAKRASVSHGLIRGGRLADELGITRLRERTGLAGIRSAHLRLFAFIDLAGTRATTISERAGISKQAVGVLIAELEAMDMVERVPDPQDGRARVVRFKERPGRTLLDGLAILGEVDAELERELGATRYRRLLSDLNAALSVLARLTSDDAAEVDRGDDAS